MKTPMKHTYVAYVDQDTGKAVRTIGYFVTLKADGTQSFVPLFDVGSQRDAIRSVSALNGGGAVRGITITREYDEGIAPHPSIPVWQEPSPT